MAKSKLTPEEYDKERARMEEKYDYEHMSDDKKAKFDESFEKVYGKKEDTEDTDESDRDDGMEREQGRRGRDDDDEEVR
jgi:hypothetical protein